MNLSFAEAAIERKVLLLVEGDELRDTYCESLHACGFTVRAPTTLQAAEQAVFPEERGDKDRIACDFDYAFIERRIWGANRGKEWADELRDRAQFIKLISDASDGELNSPETKPCSVYDLLGNTALRVIRPAPTPQIRTPSSVLRDAESVDNHGRPGNNKSAGGDRLSRVVLVILIAVVSLGIAWACKQLDLGWYTVLAYGVVLGALVVFRVLHYQSKDDRAGEQAAARDAIQLFDKFAEFWEKRRVRKSGKSKKNKGKQ
jgi:hypothetical protein